MIPSTPTFSNSLLNSTWQPSGNHIGLYLCGMTVYDLCHIGNARTMLVFDSIVRYLRFRGYSVTFVRNITDIDDRIINKALENQVSFREVADHNIEQMSRDFNSLGLLTPDHEPKASDVIDEMIEMIGTLIERGLAYQSVENGDIYYSVESFADYGKLSGQNLKALNAGSRVEKDLSKKSPFDFVLWKKEDQASTDTQAVWPTKWGNGRPGWHLECSALSNKCLGSEFEIHAGGIDLKFPHHENEIAQSHGCGHAFAQCWLHAAHITFGDEKMSKSIGNIVSLRDVLSKWGANEIKFALLSAHYRSTLEFKDQILLAARKSLSNLSRFIMPVSNQNSETVESTVRENAQLQGKLDGMSAEFCMALDDDFNTPKALSILFQICKLPSNTASSKSLISTALKTLAGAIGIELKPIDIQRNTVVYSAVDLSDLDLHIPEPVGSNKPDAADSNKQINAQITAWFEKHSRVLSSTSEAFDPSMVEKLMSFRGLCKQANQFEAADIIRVALARGGIKIEDVNSDKSVWFVDR